MSEIILTLSVRLYPTKLQEEYFNKACSTSVHVYNKAKEWDDQAYKETGKGLTRRQLKDKLKEYSTQSTGVRVTV